MEVCVLVEDTVGQAGVMVEKGLSLLIKTNHYQFLMDTGKGEALVPNCKQLGIQLSEIDGVFLSHSHSDHTGGLNVFFQQNPTAFGYMAATASCYSLRTNRPHFIGNAIAPQYQNRILEYHHHFPNIDFIQVKNHPYPTNQHLFIQNDDGFQQDGFLHERHLVVQEEGRFYLFCGCAHGGIVAILEGFRSQFHCDPYAVIGGFHLDETFWQGRVEASFFVELAQELKNFNTRYYTCHCTGQSSYDKLKKELGEQITVIRCGHRLRF